MKRLPFAFQLSLIVFLILIIPFIILMSYTGLTTLRNSEEEIARTSLEKIEVNRRLMENFTGNISNSILRFVAGHDFLAYAGLQHYSAIQGNVDNGMRILRLQRELLAIERNEDAILSVFFFFDDGDYIVSTDLGIKEISDYYSLSWLRTVSEQRQGLGGVWVPRELQSATVRELLRGQDTEHFTRVISYVYRLNRLTTAIGGTIVVNIRESSIADNLNPGRSMDDSNGIILLQRDGKVISHPRVSNFLAQARNQPHIMEILDQDENRGYEFYRDGGNRYLYTWLKTNYYEWVYISIQSIDSVLSLSARTVRNMIFISLTVLFFGSMAALAVFFWVSRPMRQLVKGIKGNPAVNKIALRNEMDILASAFTQIEDNEKELRGLLNEREKDAALLAMRNLLSGDPLLPQETEILEQVFPGKLFRVAAAALDNYEDYRRRTSAEQRAYHRYLFISRAEGIVTPPVTLRGTHLFESQIALIFNTEEELEAEKLLPLLRTLQEDVLKIFATTITVGLGETGFDLDGVHQSARQASEAVTMRMFEGSNSIIFWTYREGRKHFFYPQNSEVKILNYLNTENLAQIKTELEVIMKTIRAASGISYDNVCFIYAQLAGGTIRWLSEMNINTTGFFFNHGNVYKAIASSETMEQLNGFMIDFYQDLLNYLNKDKEKEEVIDKILSCLGKYYKTDMFFEDMAAELKMSYSYMRKIVKEKTGKSVNDTINHLRIQEAKSLLVNEKLNPMEIAGMVGYRNTQSLKRYFKKFEGITPLEYKLTGRAAQIR